MANQLRDIRANFVSFVDRAAVRDPQNKSEPRRFLLFKRDGVADPIDPALPEKGGAMSAPSTPEELQAALAKAEQERDETKEALTKAQGETAIEKTAREAAEAERDARPVVKADTEPTPIDKSALTPEVRALVEKAEADSKAMEERVAKAEKKSEESETIAKAERDQRITREWIAKAETEMPSLPGDPAETGPLMKALSEAAPEAFSKFEETVLKAASEQIKTGDLLAEKGRSGQPRRSSTDGLASAQRKAEEIQKADSSLSASEAFEKAMKDPDIEKAYLAEQRG